MTPTIVLVHGAMHTPWIFNPLREELTARGLASRAVQLPSSNPRSADTEGLAADVAAIDQGLAGIAGPVVLAAHSYGGVPATWAASHAPNVTGLVYLAAFSLPAGLSMMEWMGGDFPPNWIRSDDERAVKVGDPEQSIFTGVDERITAEAVARLNWQGIGAFTEKLGARPDSKVKTTYVVATQDVALPPAVQEEWAAQADARVAVPAGHSPHLSHPAEVADAIAEAARNA